MSSNLKVNTILPSTGTTIGIGTVGGLINIVGNIDVNSTSGISTFNGLEISGIVTVGGDVSIADKIIHTGDTNTAIRFPVGDVISAETNGAERLRITSAGTLLLGTSTGALANGNGIVIADATAARLSLKDTTNGVTGTDGFDVVQTGTDAYLYHRENGNMIFGTNATERLRIDAGGGLQLGTSTATASKLTVYGANDAAAIFQGSGTGTGAGNGLLVGNNGGTTGLLWNYENGNTLFATNNIERLRISSVGNVSLGLGGDAVPTSTAYNGGTLHIHQATSGSNGAQLKMTTAAGGSAAGDGFYIAHWGGNNETFIYNKEATNMRFGTNSAERLIIKNDGDLEITDGNLIVAPGHGIDFSDTAGTPSNGGELLDDYEEGNFTASLGGLSNWSSYSVTGQGHYVKIGKAVHININFGNVDLNNSASGSVIIFNLPFVPFVVNPDCRGVTSNYMAHKVQHANDGMIHSFYIHPTYGFKGQITKNNTSWTSWDASNFTATGVYLDFSATYFTAS